MAVDASLEHGAGGVIGSDIDLEDCRRAQKECVNKQLK